MQAAGAATIRTPRIAAKGWRATAAAVVARYEALLDGWGHQWRYGERAR